MAPEVLGEDHYNVHVAYSIADQNFKTTASIGIYNFSLGLLHALAHRPEFSEITVFANHLLEHELPAHRRVHPANFNTPIQSVLGRLVWDQLGVYSAARNSGADWLFLPKGYASFLAPPRVAVAAYIHDVIPVMYPERYPRSTNPIRSAYFRAVYKATLRQARVLFTNTEFTKSEITRWAAKEDVRCPPVIVAGYGFDSAPSGPIAKEDRVVVLTRKDPHKRSDLAIEYMKRWLEQTGYAGEITCIGTLPRDVQLPPSSQWHHLDRMGHESLLGMMRRSRTVVHFTEYEGFGMPPVESILQGTCPVYSDVPATAEAMQGRGSPFSNIDYQSFLSAMNEALTVPDAKIERWKAGLLARHHWNGVVDRIVEAIRSHT